MKSFHRIRCLIPLLTGGLFVAGSLMGEPGPKGPAGEAQAGPRPGPKPPKAGGPPQGNPQGRGDWKGGDRRGPGPGNMGSGGRPPMWGEGFETLSEEQKSRVREALEKAWGRPEVKQARDRLMRANEEMRDTIHGALKEIDPEIGTILASMRGPEHGPGQGQGQGRGEMPRMPEESSPDFPQAVVKRLEMELMAFSPPERREEARKLHARLLLKPDVHAAVLKLNEAPVPARREAMEALRASYRASMGQELNKIRDKREAETKGGDESRPPEESK